MILISSSPPPMFARDPTPFEYSPSRSPSSASAQDVSCSPKRFKPSYVTRDSFSAGFRSASNMLVVKPTAENIPIPSPGKDRFKNKNVKSSLPVRKTPPFVARNESPGQKVSSLLDDKEARELRQGSSTTVATNIVPNHAATTPQSRPVRRRLDWTPIEDDEDAEAMSAAADGETTRLMSNFGFRPTSTEHGIVTSRGTGIGITKGTRIDIVQAPATGPIIIKASKGSARAKQKPSKPKKVKAATKKAKTITELVRSHHRATNKTESPMAEYLVASQAKTWDGLSPDAKGIEVAARGIKRKVSGLKSQPRKRQLLSPASAMKAFNRQETIFGSASQLARDEPRIEADLSSDPVSPLRTQATSHGSITPRVARGSTRFVKSRNLWGAADRDDDNALLHVDSVNLYDTPLARNVYVGKDALTAPQLSAKVVSDSTNDASKGGKTNGRAHSAAPGSQCATVVVDVDDFPSPALRHRQGSSSLSKPSVRQLHTSARALQKRTADELTTQSTEPKIPGAADLLKAPPARPNYTGMQTGELQTMIKNYGFKAIRSRDKMVDLLNKCWDEKEARRATRVENQKATEAPPTPTIARHADLISNVHDLSNRPQPKAKKKPKTARVASKAKAKPETTAKEPKKRKKATVETSPSEKPKRGRPKKSKTANLEEKVVDIDDIDDDFTSLTTLRETSQVLMKKQTNGSDEPQPLPVSANASVAQDDGSKEVLASGAPSDLHQQIHAAILHQSEQAAEVDSWDHVRSPTWHEKMLMYDPIIIEDLARWLNAEGLNGVKEDREVTTVEVRDWCESRGVCCIFNGGWRGQGPKGGD